MSSKLTRLSPDSLVSNPRATLAAWTRFEPHVLIALRRHPQPYILTPDFLSPETFISRFRDAIRGKLAFDYPSSVPSAEIASWYSEIILKKLTTPSGFSVYIGPKEKLAAVAELATSTEVSTIPSLSNVSLEELNALVLLLSNSRISGPFLILSPPPFTTTLPNLQIIPRQDGSIVLL